MVIQQYFISFVLSRQRAFLLTCLIILLSLVASSTLHAESVVASLDKNVVTENEVVQLHLRADFSDTGNGPDLKPLERDFDILGKSQNSQFSFNLGTSKTRNFWVVSLMPKSVGTFEIPPIQIGDYTSESIQLVVKSSPQLLDNNGNPPVMVKTEVSEIEPYVQQEVIISVKLYTSVALQNANRSSPSHPDLVIERLVDDQVNYDTINGTQYQVITRDFLAFPQRSGTLSIPPQTLQAMVNTSTGRRQIKVQSEPLNLNVLPVPASYSSDTWLPSQKVKVTTSLEKTTDSPRVGDTLIWTIDIDAVGALPGQIPTLDFNSTRNYKLYPKSPKFSTQKTANGVTGHQTIIAEVVPTSPGALELPDINITYWDTEYRNTKVATASTNSITIAALPNTGAPVESENTTAISDPLPAQPRSVAPISLAKKPSEPKTAPIRLEQPKAVEVELINDNTGLSWRFYLIVTLLLGALIAFAVWLRIWQQKRKAKALDADNQVPTLQDFAPLSTMNEDSAFAALIECCRDNNLPQLRPNLLEWARHRWGDNEIHTVDDIKRLTSMQVTQLLMETELMMYSDNPIHEWQGEPLADALEEYISGEAKPSQESQLKSLYPNL